MDAALSVESPPPALSRNELLLAALLFVLALVPIVVWPTEVMWLIDEPRLIANAWHANHSHELAAYGLYGNFAVPYSPVPTQIYQLILAFTHDPAKIVLIHGLLNASLIALASLWLARTLRFPAWFGAAFLLAPYISLQQRVLWDASFTLPFGMLAVAGLASFLRTGGKWPLRLTLIASVQVFLVHPQALPLGIPIIGFLLWKYRPAMWADRRGLLYTGAILTLCHAKYVFIATCAVLWRFTHGGGAYPGGSRVESLLAPFLGGNLLNGYDHSQMLPVAPFSWEALYDDRGYFTDWLGYQGQLFGHSPWLMTAMWLSRLVYLFIWLGIGLAIVRAPRIFSGWFAKSPVLPIADQLATIFLFSLEFQFLLYTFARIPLGPQYYFGTFAVHAFFAWHGVAFLHRWLAGKIAAVAFLAAGATVTVCNLLHGHYYLNDKPHWPSMADCMRLVRDLNAYDDEMAYINAEDPHKALDESADPEEADAHAKIPNAGLSFIYRFPQAIRTMRLLLPPAPGQPQRHSGKLYLTYVEKNGEWTGKMIVTEYPGDTPPLDAEIINITPLTKDWVPDPGTW